MKASDLMTTDHLWACSETSDCREVARMMADHNVGSIPVLDPEGRLEGIVTDRDICCRLVARGQSFETPIRELMSRDVHAADPDMDLDDIEQIMRTYKIRRLPVVDEDSKLLGFISIGDLAKNVHGPFKEHHLVQVLEAVST